MKIILFLIFFSFHNFCHAILIDLNSGILQGSFNRTTDISNSRSINSVGIYANLGKSDGGYIFFLGWNISTLNNQDNFQGVLNQKITSSDMGPAFRWQIDRRQLFSLTYAYGIICKGVYDDTLVTENLTGESHHLKFSIEPEIFEHFFIGVGINYYSSNYKTVIINSVQSEINYKNSLMYPSLSLSYRY